MERTFNPVSVKQEPGLLKLEEGEIAKKSSEDIQREEEERKIFNGLTKAEHRERFPFGHLDERWRRTVWYCKREHQYKSRDPTKEVQWERPAGWKPETAAEAETRAICSRYKIWRLDQEEAKVGCVYNYFGHPEKKVRIVGKVPLAAPRVEVIPYPNLDQDVPKAIFADELEAKRHCKRTKKKANKSRPYKKFRSIS